MQHFYKQHQAEIGKEIKQIHPQTEVVAKMSK